MKRLEKESLIPDIREILLSSSAVVVVDRSFGITVGEITSLRKKMRTSGSNLKILKNTLARIAIKDSGLSCLQDCLNGPTALAYSNDSIEMTKALIDFSKENEKFAVLGGVIDGNFVGVDDIKAIASLPSVDELRAKLVGLLVAAAGKVVRIIKEPSTKIARVLIARG